MTVEIRYATERKGMPAWETWRYSKGDSASRVLAGWQVSVDDLFDGLV